MILFVNISVNAQTVVLQPKSTFTNNSNESLFLLNRKTLEFLVIQANNAKGLDSLIKDQSLKYGLILNKLERDNTAVRDSLRESQLKLTEMTEKRDYWFKAFWFETATVSLTILAIIGLKGI